MVSEAGQHSGDHVVVFTGFATTRTGAFCSGKRRLISNFASAFSGARDQRSNSP